MKSGRICSLFVLGSLFSLLLAGCSSGANSGGSGGGTTPPPTASITSVTVSCNATTVPTTQTTQCAATVKGTGSYSSAVAWSVNNVAGGNSTVGPISSTGLYTAPAAVPSPFTTTVTATSSADSTKSASVPIIVAGTIATASQAISAASGGTITLPDGSSVTIPANAFPADQMVTLSEVSALSQQPPNSFIVGAGIGLKLAFSAPIQPNLRNGKTRASTRGIGNLPHPDGQTPSNLTFNINQTPVTSGLNGALGLAEVVDDTNTTSYLSTAYTAGNQSSSLSVPTSWLGGLQHAVSSVAVSAVNTVYQVFAPLGLQVIELPSNRCWQSGTSWTDFSNCSSKIQNARVLVVVHGMMSCVETTYSDDTLKTLAPHYDVIVGFDYDWTQHLTDSGALLEAFLEKIAQSNPASIDIIAHSEGVPVSLYAASQTPDRAKISNFFGLAGPILGTPIANEQDYFVDQAINSNYKLSVDSCPASADLHLKTVTNALLQSPFIQDLQPQSDALKTMLPAVRINFGNTNARIFVAGGENQELALGELYRLQTPFGVTPNDGVIGLDSALAYNAGFTVHPFPPFTTLNHTQLPNDPGVLGDIVAQLAHGNSPQLTCLSASSNCAGAPDSAFTFSGTGFTNSATNVLVYSQDQTGKVALLPTPGLQLSSGTMSWPMPLGTEPTGLFSIFSYDETLASNNVMQTIGPAVTVDISPKTASLAPGGTQYFTAVMAGTSNTGVSWSVQGGSASGTITSSGLYTAPATPGTYHVVATSQADPGASATATVDVSGPVSAVTISPVSASLTEGGVQAFTATVSGGGGVNWSIQEGSSGGTLVSTGLSEGPPNGTGPSTYTANYFAPNTTGTFHVVATSQVDPGVSATAAVDVSGLVSTVTINPTSVSVPALAVQTFSASVSGGGQINWSIQEGASGGAITNFGIYTAPASYGTFHIVATNAADPTETAVAVVTVGPGPLITSLHSFNRAVEGANPWSALIQGSDGDFYGTTEAGGDLSCSYLTTLSGCGTVFKMDGTGNVTVLHSFTGADGIYPTTNLTLAKDGSLYGTTSYGGRDIPNCVIGGTSIAAGCGTIFKIDPSSNFSQVYSFSSFSSPEGVSPTASLILASDGNLYGATIEGGDTLCTGTSGSISASGCGGLFKIDAAGTLVPLHSFSGSDGAYPASALLEAAVGSFYGTTMGGGNLSCSSYASPGCGFVFKTDSSGNITNLYSFSQQDGAAPDAALIRGTDGSLYGTTLFGGSAPCTGGAPWAGCGTIFKIDTAGKMTVLHSFSGPDGAYPAQLIQASDGFFYGTTESGGDSSCQGRYGPGCGTVFRMDAAGNITAINTFTGESDGSWPESALIQGTDGDLYGTTVYGGTNDDGVVFRISNLNFLNSIKSQTALVRRDGIQVNAIAVKRPHFGLPLAAAPAGRP